MSLLELLNSMPSAQDRYQQLQPLLAGVRSGGPQYGVPGPTGGSGNVEGQARDFFLSNGYSPQDWRKVDYIIDEAPNAESHWDPHALNDSSGAAGIAQKISGFGDGYRRNDPMSQIRWLFNYLGSHSYGDYGTGIDAAYQHKLDTGWY